MEIKLYEWALFIVDEYGDMNKFRTGIQVAKSTNALREAVIEAHWDPRLEAASCSPEVTSVLLKRYET